MKSRPTTVSTIFNRRFIMRNKLTIFGALAALVLILSACGPSVTASGERFINVTGSGVVYLNPDVAYLYVGVHVEDKDINIALSNNNLRTQTLIGALVTEGVATSDIQTSNFSVWSQEAWDEFGMPYTKYTVDNSVYITVRDLGALGDLLNTVVEAGANNISSITFDVSDKTTAMAEARRLAMENADALAEELATTAGLRVGEIQNITYSESYPSPYYGMGGGGAAMESASVPIQPGKMQASVTVTVTYSIK
jgi:uncharacterized protein